MRIATAEGRLTLLIEGCGVDVAEASGGRFSSDPQAVFEVWPDFVAWAQALPADAPVHPVDLASEAIGAPAPRPRQVFAIGLNYRAHAKESDLTYPTEPPTFTKFPCSLTGPRGELSLPVGLVDWEVELVAVMGRAADRVQAGDAWSYVAGLTIGQDFSERRLQTAGPVPQFSLGKSFPGFGPIGPVLVSPDEFADPDDLAIECDVNGETVQKDRTSSMIFSVPQLIEKLSEVCTLYPGDLIFTGTPSGVGHARKPPRYLKSGDVVSSRIEGLGEMRHVCRDLDLPAASADADRSA